MLCSRYGRPEGRGCLLPALALVPADRSGALKARGEAASKRALIGDAAEFPDVGCDAVVDHAFVDGSASSSLGSG